MFKKLRSPLCFLLCCLLIELPQLRSQQQQASGLTLTVLAGEGATNVIDKTQGTLPVVQVLDAQGEPLAGALVTFRAPLRGPSVTFFGANAEVKVHSDPEGRAQAPSTLPNTYEGPFTIDVSANYQGSTVSAEIHETNLEAEKPAKKKKWYKGWPIAGIAVVVTIVIIAVALRAGDDQ